MSCCASNIPVDQVANVEENQRLIHRDTLEHAGHREQDGTRTFVFSVPQMHCGACISRIEKGLRKLPSVIEARANLTLKRVTIRLKPDGDATQAEDVLQRLGFDATPIDMGDLSDIQSADRSSGLLKALAVAGFAAGNIMLLSVSVWSGAEGSARDLFHLISAFIAVPTVAYSGQVFFNSAWGALKAGRLNMDVPISLAVILALLMSLFETMNSGSEAYFDAAVTLLFFLLIGRYLDQRMREKARGSVLALSKLAAKGATVILPSGQLQYVPLDEIEKGMQLKIMPGDRVAVDCKVVNGNSDLDRSLVTGESDPQPAGPKTVLEAGVLNLTGTLQAEAISDARSSFLSEIVAMLEAAETGRGNYTRIADRMASIYAPAVHLLALFAFIGWMIATGGNWHLSIYTAIAVLIITCPCALGLAVPVAHVIGASRLLKEGILMRDGSAIERLAEIDRVAFDKTGTLTTGKMTVTQLPELSKREKQILKSLASSSRHPASRAIYERLCATKTLPLHNMKEVPGFGMEAQYQGETVRLGRSEWVAEIANGSDREGEGLAFAIEGQNVCAIPTSETARADAEKTVSQLIENGLKVYILSGDAGGKVRVLAGKLGIEEFIACLTPKGKIDWLERLSSQGSKVLMIGDGLNDTPSLAAAHVSMAPANAVDAGRAAADFVFTRDSLSAVVFAQALSRRVARVVRQNFAIAIVYNCIAVPLAMAGIVTPLFAAIAMSASSVVVIGNSLRLMRNNTHSAQILRTNPDHRTASPAALVNA